MASQMKQCYLFGGERSWKADDWVASDDRVRGGKSQSYLTPEGDGTLAKFHGTLDIKTLGGAGFASQRTTGDDWSWDLSPYDGLRIAIAKADEKQYTLILKDSLLPQSPDGREQSTISYEYDFDVNESGLNQKDRGNTVIDMPWTSLKPTYRGREKKDAPRINLQKIKRLSIMMRSFFGTQEGDFEINIRSIAATNFDNRNRSKLMVANHPEQDDMSVSTLQKPDVEASGTLELFGRLCSRCTVS